MVVQQAVMLVGGGCMLRSSDLPDRILDSWLGPNQGRSRGLPPPNKRMLSNNLLAEQNFADGDSRGYLQCGSFKKRANIWFVPAFLVLCWRSWKAGARRGVTGSELKAMATISERKLPLLPLIDGYGSKVNNWRSTIHELYGRSPTDINARYTVC